MNRRRALMAQSKKPSDILFELNNRSVSTGEYVDTNVKPFLSDVDCTILLDIQINANPTSSGAVASTTQLLRVYDTSIDELSFAIGKQSRSYSTYSKKWMSLAWSGLTNSTPAVGRKRFAITHKANKVVVTIVYKMDDGSVYSWASDRNWHSIDDTLTLGGGSNIESSLPASTINLVRVYNRVLTTEEINDFFT